MISSLELAPKGIYKLNDENPKIIEFEEEAKIPEFAEMATVEGWLHRNPNLLHVYSSSTVVRKIHPLY